MKWAKKKRKWPVHNMYKHGRKKKEIRVSACLLESRLSPGLTVLPPYLYLDVDLVVLTNTTAHLPPPTTLFVLALALRGKTNTVPVATPAAVKRFFEAGWIGQLKLQDYIGRLMDESFTSISRESLGPHVLQVFDVNLTFLKTRLQKMPLAVTNETKEEFRARDHTALLMSVQPASLPQNATQSSSFKPDLEHGAEQSETRYTGTIHSVDGQTLQYALPGSTQTNIKRWYNGSPPPPNFTSHHIWRPPLLHCPFLINYFS